MSRDHPYVLLTYQQLVGVCLYVFIRPEHANQIRDVAVDCVKTGLGGATGNKGATAIRFVFYGTSLCFVCSHFAAGQNQVAERNADYAEITRKIAFPMVGVLCLTDLTIKNVFTYFYALQGRTLKSHDYVFWCGDFNYRIDMDKEELREMIKQGSLSQILESDQLMQQKQQGHVFNDFIEGEITFAPTYKYDLFSDDYDTSEKNRAPAWTDRVLWRRRKPHPDADKAPDWHPGQLVHYGRSDLKQSDHRPVMAIIDIEISEIDTNRRKKVFHDVILDLGPPDATIVITMDGGCAADTADQDSDEGGGIYDEDLTAALIQELTQIGEVTLVRYVGETMWITFRDGQSALTAVQKRSICVCGHNLNFKLKTENWLELVEQEIDLCSSNTVQLCDYQKADYNCLGIPKVPPQRPKSPTNKPGPPHRPPLPKSPNPSPKHIPKAGVISVCPDMLVKVKPMTEPPSGPPPMMPPPVMSTSYVPVPVQDSAAIYEEINDDIVLFFILLIFN